MIEDRKAKIQHALSMVLQSAAQILPSEDNRLWTENVRTHLMDRWYWLADFGIEGRADLKDVEIRVETPESKYFGSDCKGVLWEWVYFGRDCKGGRRTTIDFSRTKLA